MEPYIKNHRLILSWQCYRPYGEII